MPPKNRKIPAANKKKAANKAGAAAALDNSLDIEKLEEPQTEAVPKVVTTKKAVAKPIAKSKNPNYTKATIYLETALLLKLKGLAMQPDFKGDVSDLVGELIKKELAS